VDEWRKNGWWFGSFGTWFCERNQEWPTSLPFKYIGIWMEPDNSDAERQSGRVAQGSHQLDGTPESFGRFMMKEVDLVWTVGLETEVEKKWIR
jgi:hypothetical protein